VTPTKKRELTESYLKKYDSTPLSWLLEALNLSRNGWYHKQAVKPDNSGWKQKIEAVLIESPYYGYKRMARQLKNSGEKINHKKVYRIMGEYCLLQPRRSQKTPKTTNSQHHLTVYTNEIKYLDPVLPREVWVADITYVRIGTTFAYLALIMDQGSRKIVGWAMSRSLHRELCVEALNMALADNQPPRYHHSDRGVQYCSHDYIEILKSNNITPSMADAGVSVDNPYAESLNRSIKVEEVYLNAYESFEEAKMSIQKYILGYNTKRLHSSLGYMCPVDYIELYQLTSVSKNLNLVVSN